MNNRLRTWFAAALLAALVPAQTVPAEPAAALARAKVLEEREGDLKAAEQAYRALLDGKDADAVHAEAALRLGAMLWKLDRKDDAKPFLERAVAMGGDLGAQARAVLQGQGEAEKQAQERLARARALVSRIDDLSWQRESDGGVVHATGTALDAALRDLKWLGPLASQAIVERLDGAAILTDSALTTANGQPVPNFRLLVDTLWAVGSETAQQYLRRTAAEADVAWRRFVTRHIETIAPDLLPTLVLFLRDPDPTGEVQRNLEQHLTVLPIALLTQLASDEHPGARAAAWQGLGRQWESMPLIEREQTFAAIAGPLQRSLRDAEPRAARAAWSLIAKFADSGPRKARELLLAELAHHPNEFHFSPQNIRFPFGDGEISMLAAAGRELAAPGAVASRQFARDPVAWMLRMHDPEWTAISVDGLIDLVEFGFVKGGGESPRWLTRLLALAQPPQLVRFVRSLPNIQEPREIITQLSKAQLPPEVLPALREVIEACLANPPAKWRVFTEQELRRTTTPVRSQGPDADLGALLWLVGKTKTPAAAIWLVEQFDRRPALASIVARALVELSWDGVGEPARAGMRKLLVWEGTPEVELNRQHRSMLFAELARVGDEPAIMLFPRAYELGLSDYTPDPTRYNRPNQTVQPFAAIGIGFLGLGEFTNGGVAKPWHGYTDAQIVQAWRALLTSPARDLVWQELTGSLLQGRIARQRIPTPVMPLIAEQLPARWAAATMQEQGQMQSTVLTVFQTATPDSVAPGGRWRDVVAALLRADDAQLAHPVFAQLPFASARQFADEGRAILHRTKYSIFFETLLRAGIELTVDDWQFLLRDPGPHTVTAALRALPVPLDPLLRSAVEGLLTAEAPEVRATACSTLARATAVDSVAALLQALRDGDEKVRKAATEALEQIRFQQEQQAFWANAKSGIDVSTPSAAAKLLAQGKPGETKDQRLLAIRSLAVLAAPESLPYLIDWTKDPDTEIAAAAREAVATIHRMAGAKK